jgi:ferredoxin
MTYERFTCYFFSGTGNSYSAAQWMAQAAADKGTATSVIPIADGRPHEDLQGGPDQLVGICHPTHGLMPPWSMIKFLIKMPWGRGAHAVIIATRGGIPLGRVVIPGAAGLALFFPLLILLLKGYRVRGGMGIDLPANILNIHWGFKPQNVDHIIAWGRRRHQRLVDAVLAKKRYWNPINVLWELIWCAPFFFWPLFPIAYLLVGRVFMAKLMFADTSCQGCGRCARNCPCHAIAMVGNKSKTPFWTHRCEVCMRCMGYCKFQAVQASHLWMIPVLFGTSFLSASYVQKILAALLGRQFALVDPAYELMSVFLVFLSLPVFYYVFWGLQRFRPFRTIFTYTTLTKFYSRRYHAPETTPKEMNRRSEPNAQ